LSNSIRLGENALASLTLTINRCAVNRAVGNGNLLSAIVTGLHENALSSTVIYTVLLMTNVCRVVGSVSWLEAETKNP
jgi:hypothetical protein